MFLFVQKGLVAGQREGGWIVVRKININQEWEFQNGS